jgi:hypothetical protein
MHIIKNICESLVGTLLNIKGKMKDGMNTRKYMAVMKNEITYPRVLYIIEERENKFVGVSKVD